MFVGRGVRIGRGITFTLTSIAEAVDEFFRQTVLLLNGDGTNGGQNNTFLDSSPNNFTITRNGNVTQGSFTPFSVPEGYWGNYFDGTGDYLTVGDTSSTLAFGTGDFTIEMWVYSNAFTSFKAIYDQRPQNTQGAYPTIYAASGVLYYYVSSANRITGPTLLTNTWYHIAVCRSGTSTRMFVNGTQVGSTYSDSTNYLTASGRPFIASFSDTIPPTSGDQFAGYISNVRVVKGTAVYTSNFTPPTTPITAITNTSLLTCQSNRFKDNSTNNFTLTPNGDVRVVNFGPFAPPSSYDIATNYGSLYFDGDGSATSNNDRLDIANDSALNFGSGDFTIDCWVYLTAAPTVACRILEKSVSSTDYQLLFQATGSIISFQYTTTGSSPVGFSSTTAIPRNQWTHLAVTRNGTAWTIWINGISSGTYTASATIFSGTSPLYVGNRNSPDRAFPGYISNLRIVKGTALYTGTFTPPTSPQFSVAGTSLLLDGTNGSIVDLSARNNLETVGNAQVSTSVTKFGTGSLYFDGNDSLTAISNPLYFVGTGDFTIEFWGRWNALSSVSPGNVFTCVSSGSLGVWVNDTTVQLARAGIGGDLSATVTQSTGVWNHYAITRQSGTARIFKDGILLATGSVSTNYGQNGVALGGSLGSSTNGYIDDFRFTVGVARYTSNFTPPSGPLPTK